MLSKLNTLDSPQQEQEDENGNKKEVPAETEDAAAAYNNQSAQEAYLQKMQEE